MTIKTTLSTLDDVPEQLHELYAESDDGFVLQVADIDNHPEVVNLKNAYTRVKQEREQLREKLQQLPSDFDPQQWENVKSGKAKEEDLIALRKELESEIDKWKSKADQLEGETFKLTLSQQLDDSLKSVGITNPAFQKAARALLISDVSLKDGKAVVETDMGPMQLADHVKRWASSEEGASFVTPAVGGGARGGEKPNKVVSVESFKNMGDLERKQLFENNPEDFKRLVSELKGK